MTTGRAAIVIAFALAVPVALAGCGGSSAPSTGGSGTTEPAPPPSVAPDTTEPTPPSVAPGTTEPAPPPSVEPVSTEPTLTVAPAPDDAHAASALIDFGGGELVATGADGTVYTLIVPPDAVPWPTTITMTPLAAIDGMPWGDGEVHAVQLEPSGLILDEYARLTIEPQAALPPDEQILFGYEGRGTALALAMPDLAADGNTILLTHFSGYGAQKGYLSDVEAIRQQLGGTAQQQISNEIAALFQGYRAEMKADPSVASAPMPYETRQELERLLERFKQEVVDVRLEAAGTSCATARLAADTVLEYQRKLELLAVEVDVSGLMEQALGLMGPCVEEEYEMCAQQHVVHRIVPVWKRLQRHSDTNGGAGADVVELARQRVEDCLHFELELTSDGRLDISDASGGKMTTAVTATVPFEFRAAYPPDFEYESKPLRNTEWSFSVAVGEDPCTVIETPGDGVFEPRRLSWEVDWGQTPDGAPGGLDATMGEVTAVVLVWAPEPTQESTVLSCPEGSQEIPHGPIWSGQVWEAGHEHEMKGNPEGYWIENWTLVGAGIWAQKEYSESSVRDGFTVQEETLFTLRHIPKEPSR